MNRGQRFSLVVGFAAIAVGVLLGLTSVGSIPNEPQSFPVPPILDPDSDHCQRTNALACRDRTANFINPGGDCGSVFRPGDEYTRAVRVDLFGNPTGFVERTECDDKRAARTPFVYGLLIAGVAIGVGGVFVLKTGPSEVQVTEE